MKATTSQAQMSTAVFSWFTFAKIANNNTTDSRNTKQVEEEEENKALPLTQWVWKSGYENRFWIINIWRQMSVAISESR